MNSADGMQVQRIPSPRTVNLEQSKGSHRTGKAGNTCKAEGLEIDPLFLFGDRRIDIGQQVTERLQPCRARLLDRSITEIEAEIVFQPAIERVLHAELEHIGRCLALRDRSRERVLRALDDLLSRGQRGEPRHLGLRESQTAKAQNGGCCQRYSMCSR